MEIHISEAYQKGEGFPLTIVDFGRWSMSDGLVLFSNESKFDRRTLEGIRLTVTSIKARWTSKIKYNGNLYVAVESFM